jgi:hypothetical protein
LNFEFGWSQNPISKKSLCIVFKVQSIKLFGPCGTLKVQRTITLHSLKIMRVLTIDLHHRWILNFILVFCHWHSPHIQLDPTPSLTMFYSEWNAIIQGKHTEEKSFDIKYRIYKIPTWASYLHFYLLLYNATETDQMFIFN